MERGVKGVDTQKDECIQTDLNGTTTDLRHFIVERVVRDDQEKVKFSPQKMPSSHRRLNVLTAEENSRMTDRRGITRRCQTTVSSHSQCRQRRVYGKEGNGDGGGKRLGIHGRRYSLLIRVLRGSQAARPKFQIQFHLFRIDSVITQLMQN